MVDDAEEQMAAAIYSMPDLREVCHHWLDDLLDAMVHNGKLGATAQVGKSVV